LERCCSLLLATLDGWQRSTQSCSTSARRS
jgi:hypothetical protein